MGLCKCLQLYDGLPQIRRIRRAKVCIPGIRERREVIHGIHRVCENKLGWYSMKEIGSSSLENNDFHFRDSKSDAG